MCSYENNLSQTQGRLYGLRRLVDSLLHKVAEHQPTSTAHWLLTGDCYDDLALPGFDVAFQMEDLLPSAEHGLAIGDGYQQ